MYDTLCNILKYIFTQCELKMEQRMWLELTKDYDSAHNYRDGKANKVVDSISRTKKYSSNSIGVLSPELYTKLHKLNLEIMLRYIFL